MELGLKGKRAVVAAASDGLGLEVARSLSVEGALVAICGRDPKKLQDAAAAIGAIPFQADLSDPENAAAFVGKARSQFGGLDILVTNSGGPPIGNFESSIMPDYESALRSNLLSAVAMCKEAIPVMKAQRWGRVLAITSVAARRPRPRVLMTGIARSGLTAFFKALSLEVAASGITVNTIQPGLHRTRRLDYLYGEKVDELAKDIPVGVLGRPQDFGQVAAFLCSEQARYVTGTSMLVDGGAYPAIY